MDNLKLFYEQSEKIVNDYRLANIDDNEALKRINDSYKSITIDTDPSDRIKLLSIRIKYTNQIFEILRRRN